MQVFSSGQHQKCSVSGIPPGYISRRTVLTSPSGILLVTAEPARNLLVLAHPEGILVLLSRSARQ